MKRTRSCIIAKRIKIMNLDLKKNSFSVGGIIIFYLLFFEKNIIAQSFPEVKVAGSEVRKITSS